MIREYSYSDVKTLRDFAKDNTFMRAVVGPFGCLSFDTEYFTRAGWRAINQYSGGEVAVFNLSTERISFELPEKYIKLPCDSFLHLKNKFGIDQLLSDEHTVLFTTRFQPDRWQTITALDLSEKHNTLRDGWSGCIHTTFGSPLDVSGVDLSDEELRLMIAISADGHFPKRTINNLCVICLRKERKKERIRKILLECGIDWREGNSSSRPTETRFIFRAPENNKRLSRYYQASERQLKIIADEIVHWDGCVDKYGGVIFSSSDPENADLAQYAFAISGKRSTVTRVSYSNPAWNDIYRVYVGTSATRLSLRQSPTIDRVPSSDGFKYCFKTSTGFLIARRNGRIFVTGNSGKSSACCVEIYRRAQAQEPSSDGVRKTRFAVVRNSYPQLRDTTIPTWLSWFEELGELKISDHDFYLRFSAPDGTPVQSIIHFRPLDKPTDIKNLLSLEVTGAFFNEMREIPMSIVNAMRGRVGRYPAKNSDGTGGATWRGIWGDSNPCDVDAPFYKLFEEDQPHACNTCRTPKGQMVLLPGRKNDSSLIPLMQRQCPMCKKGIENSFPLTKVFHQPSGFSPEAENIKNLPPDYYQVLAAGMDRDFISVYCEGKYGYIKEGKPVYANYDSAWHYSKEPLKARPNYPLIISFDNTGLTQACVVLQYLPTGQLRVLHEWLVEGIGTRRLCRDLVRPFIYSTYPGIMMYFTGDPAGIKRADTDERNTFEEISEAFGVQATPARSNAWQSRFNAVDSFLIKRIGNNEPGLLVSTECKMLHRGFMGEYRMRRLQVVSQEKFVNRPEKNLVANIHDALQYGCLFIEDFHELSRRDKFDASQIMPQQGAGDWGAFS